MTPPVTSDGQPTPRPATHVGASGARDRNNPTIWEAMRVDPTLHVPFDSREIQMRDQQRWTRYFVRPVIRVVAMVVIHLALFLKRLVPFKLGSEGVLNWLGPRFMRRCASPEALALVLRHFVVESNLINFVARNSGADDVAEVSLRPVRAQDLADDHGLNAVVRHDANIFNLVIDLGESPTADITTTRPAADLDFSMLTIPVLSFPYTESPGDPRQLMALARELSAHSTIARPA